MSNKKLKYKEVHYFELDYDDLEEFIGEHYEQDHSVIMENELSNDSQKTFSVDTNMYEWDKKAVANFAENGGSCSTRAILCDLATKGLIPIGKYIVRISW